MAIRTLFSTVLMIAVSRFSLSTFSRTRPKTISSRHPGNLPPKLPCTDAATLVPSHSPACAFCSVNALIQARFPAKAKQMQCKAVSGVCPNHYGNPVESGIATGTEPHR